MVKVLHHQGAARVFPVGLGAVEGEDEGVAEVLVSFAADGFAQPQGRGVGKVGARQQPRGDGRSGWSLLGAEAPMVRVTVPFELMRIELWCRQSGRRTRMAKLWRRPVATTSCTPREWAAWREARLRALTRPSSPSKVPSRSIAIRRIALLRAAAVKLPPGLSILGDRIVVVTYGTHRVGLSCYSGWTRWN